MREEFLRKNLVKVGVSIFVGVILTICSFIYIIANIYTSIQLTVPTVILVIGLIIQIWGFWRLKSIGKISDKEDPDFDEP